MRRENGNPNEGLLYERSESGLREKVEIALLVCSLLATVGTVAMTLGFAFHLYWRLLYTLIWLFTGWEVWIAASPVWSGAVYVSVCASVAVCSAVALGLLRGVGPVGTLHTVRQWLSNIRSDWIEAGQQAATSTGRSSGGESTGEPSPGEPIGSSSKRRALAGALTALVTLVAVLVGAVAFAPHEPTAPYWWHLCLLAVHALSAWTGLVVYVAFRGWSQP